MNSLKYILFPQRIQVKQEELAMAAEVQKVTPNYLFNTELPIGIIIIRIYLFNPEIRTAFLLLGWGRTGK